MKGLNRSGYVNQGKEELWKDDTVFKYMKAAIKKQTALYGSDVGRQDSNKLQEVPDQVLEKTLFRFFLHF